MHYLRFKECLVILVLFQFVLSIPLCERSQHSSILCNEIKVQSVPSLPDFPEELSKFGDMLNGFNDMDSTIAPSTTPPSTANDNPATQNPPSSTTTPSSPEPFSTENPIQFYIDQFKKKSDSNKEKNSLCKNFFRLYNMNTPVERLRIKLHKLVDILIDWIKNLD